MMKVLIILAISVVIYLVLGSLVFHFLESVDPTAKQQHIQNITRKLLAEYECLTDEDLQRIVTTYVEAFSMLDLNIVNKSNTDKWDMPSSIVFSINVITTIGYGNVYPVTMWGQLFCVAYAIIGIPLCLVLLSKIGSKLKEAFSQCDKLIPKQDQRSKRTRHVVKLAIIITLGCIFFIMLPAVVFSQLEGWTYVQAFYYCVVTLTTIGFGDLIPGDAHHDTGRVVYHVMIGVWIFIGLAWVAGLIRYIQHGYADVMDKAQKSIRNRPKFEAPDKLKRMVHRRLKSLGQDDDESNGVSPGVRQGPEGAACAIEDATSNSPGSATGADLSQITTGLDELSVVDLHVMTPLEKTIQADLEYVGVRL